MAGENPSHESAEKLNDLARAADLFAAEGFSTSSYLFRRKLDGGKTLMDVVREGGSAQDAARLLLQIAQKETVRNVKPYSAAWLTVLLQPLTIRTLAVLC